MSRSEVFRIAHEVHSKLFDPVKEPNVKVPDYAGITPELSKIVSCNPPADYTTPARQKRPVDGQVANSVLELIGNTPMVRCSRLEKRLDLETQILAKAEYFSAGGSIKDRIALRMIEEGERNGTLKPGDTLIEPTSGNTGVGLCLAGAVKGYNVIITLPQKMSGEKVNMMKSLGAEILRTPTEAAWNAPDSHITLALRLQQAIPRSHVLDQYKNPGNPLAHYDTTAEEILEQTNGGDFTHLFLSAGTGGTLTGIARKIREKAPHVKIIAIDPVGSILALPDNLNDHKRLEAYQVEGIGYDFIPTVLDREVADSWLKIDDPEAFQYARALIRYEGMAVGGSSGSAMSGAVKYIREHKLGKESKVVVVLPDSCRNYMSKFLDDKWMESHGFSLQEQL